MKITAKWPKILLITWFFAAGIISASGMACACDEVEDGQQQEMAMPCHGVVTDSDHSDGVDDGGCKCGCGHLPMVYGWTIPDSLPDKLKPQREYAQLLRHELSVIDIPFTPPRS